MDPELPTIEQLLQEASQLPPGQRLNLGFMWDGKYIVMSVGRGRIDPLPNEGGESVTAT